MTKHWRDSMNDRNQDWIKNREKPSWTKSDGGKGDTLRRVDQQKYRDNWDRIFGDKNGTGTTEEPTE
jgi:hypothetical protein